MSAFGTKRTLSLIRSEPVPIADIRAASLRYKLGSGGVGGRLDQKNRVTCARRGPMRGRGGLARVVVLHPGAANDPHDGGWV